MEVRREQWSRRGGDGAGGGGQWSQGGGDGSEEGVMELSRG